MRKKLQAIEGERKKFTGRFVRLGKRINFNGHSEETILIENICDADTGAKLTDHVWFSFSKSFQEARIFPGCLIEFMARVKKYSKGYVNRRYRVDNRTSDFKLSHPTAIKQLDKEQL